MNDYHDKITELFDEYYSDKPTPIKRIDTSNALIEHYIERHGKRPPASVLSRLATYILLDTLTDSHPDKMAREEYPILSKSQRKRREKTFIPYDELPYGDVRFLGKRKVNSSMLTDDGVDKDDTPFVSQIRLIPQRYSEADEVVDRLNVRYVIDNAGLTERECQVVDIFLETGANQDEIATKLNISQARVSQLINAAIDKISENNVV